MSILLAFAECCVMLASVTVGVLLGHSWWTVHRDRAWRQAVERAAEDLVAVMIAHGELRPPTADEEAELLDAWFELPSAGDSP